MKKVLILILTLVLILSGCTKEDEKSGSYYVLPDLNGKTLVEIEDLFTQRNQAYEIIYETVEDEELELQFIMYMNYDTGDVVDNYDVVQIKVYPAFTGTRTFVYLPDLSGFTSSEIEAYFDAFGLNVSFIESYDVNDELTNTFYGYSGYEIGDKFYFTSTLGVIIYKEVDAMDQYFFPIDMEYDGPLLDESFADIDPVDPRGGYFEVTLNYCTDGDTGVFHYPQEIYDLILSSAKSTRFLNMDTEETYSGGEEEWGKPGSVYTCELLTSAESIILQTDPGDALTGTYGRLLAWVWVKLPGEEEYFLLNYMVVKQGLAQVKFEFGAGETISYGDHTYNEWMHIAEDYAKANELGQWGDLLDYYWDYATDSPYYSRWYND
jgi:endonuclease YncB( thermonuclease family)